MNWTYRKATEIGSGSPSSGFVGCPNKFVISQVSSNVYDKLSRLVSSKPYFCVAKFV